MNDEPPEGLSRSLRRLARSEVHRLREEALEEARNEFRARFRRLYLEELWNQVEPMSPAQEEPVGPGGLFDQALGTEVGPPPAPAGEARELQGSGWYAYAVLDAAASENLAGPGLDRGKPLEVIRGARLAVVLSEVDLAGLAEGPGDESDLASLEAKLRSHDEILRSLLGRGSLLPMRFGTVFRDREDARRWFHEHEQELSEEVDRLRGHQEWAVKVYRDRAAMAGWVLARKPRLATIGRGGGGEGASYLNGRRVQREVDRDVDEATADAVAMIEASLEDLARSVARPPLLARTAEREAVSSLALLMGEGDVGRLEQRVARLNRDFADRGLELELTGPWPPYNFVSIRMNAEGGG